MRLAKWRTYMNNYYYNHERKAEDRDFCLTVLDENRLFITGLLDYQDNSKRDQTWIYTKGKGWAKSTPMPQMRQGMACGVIPKITGVRRTGVDAPITHLEEARVVVVGGYINGNYLKTVEIFTLKTETYEYGGETFSGTTGKWTTGRIRLTPLS